MVNITDFTDRLKIIMTHYQLSASLLADKIAVQRSSISHILSGRNKPSLDFVLKITNTFKEVDIYWLLNGKGSFPKNEEIKSINTPTPTIHKSNQHNTGSTTPNKTIKRVLIFYSDGTFEEFKK